ncbi:hypothetical protein ABW21_db0208461 [Orbilia brochopaga]|nr:hypothetical protein ABW21_db0208461 [Drechslerella brochopaga]
MLFGKRKIMQVSSSGHKGRYNVNSKYASRLPSFRTRMLARPRALRPRLLLLLPLDLLGLRRPHHLTSRQRDKPINHLTLRAAFPSMRNLPTERLTRRQPANNRLSDILHLGMSRVIIH